MRQVQDFVPESFPGDPGVEGPLNTRQSDTDVGCGTDLLHAYAESARLQAAHAARMRLRAEGAEAALTVVRRSTSWRATWPLRLGGHAINALAGRDAAQRAHAAAVLRSGIAWWAGLIRQRTAMLGRPALAADRRNSIQAAYTAPVDVPPDVAVAPAVLIVAELSIPQCAKYRVWQRQELLQLAGERCTVADWRDHAAVMSGLQICTTVVFYRVPLQPLSRPYFAEARRLGLRMLWEVDDLIFDPEIYAANSNLKSLPAQLRADLLAGSAEYRRGLLECAEAIASTESLAEVMRAVGVPTVYVIENALDRETLAAAQAIRSAPPRRGPGVVIAYGSGTSTHDADFALVADAVATLMREDTNLLLRIVGELNLPPVMDNFHDRIQRHERLDYVSYLRLLSQSDISIAPLEPGAFNDAKSNIKYLEAAILGLPSVCSPRRAFRDVIAPGRTAFLAETAGEWREALRQLIARPVLRSQMGEVARQTVLERYAPNAVARHTARVLVKSGPRPTRRMKVLSVNVFYAPRSFGGATIIAEEMATRLNARPDTEVVAFTTQGHTGDERGTLLRYRIQGVTVFGVAADGADEIQSFDDPVIAERFDTVLEATAPDIVHFHSIQSISTAAVRVCQRRGIPYVVTLHDAWWLCARQFMVRGDGRYCGQTQIDLSVCQACLPGVRHLETRRTLMQTALAGARLVLAPSAFHRALHIANGCDAQRILVHRNGVRMPARPHTRGDTSRLRFGFVGGNEAVKGSLLVREAFALLPHGNYDLILVDSTLNLGFSSIRPRDWPVRGRLQVVPGYTQDTMDEFYDRIDVLLFPSQWKESFGMTVREALARDIWVIATDGGGQSEDIVDGVNGTLIPLDGRADGLRDAVRALLDSPQRLQGHANPYKARIMTFDAQAESLHRILAAASAGARPELAA